MRRFKLVMSFEWWELSVGMLMILRVVIKMPDTAGELAFFIHISAPYEGRLSRWC